MLRSGHQRCAAWIAAAAGVLSVAAALPLGAPTPGEAQYRSQYVHQRVIEVQGPHGEPQKALVLYPRRTDGRTAPVGERYPLVVALHGRGESLRGPDRGFLGWGLDYQLPEAFGAFARGRLAYSDYRSLVSERHLRMVNQSLRADPFDGLLVAAPFTPDLTGEAEEDGQLAEWSAWVAGSFLEQVREQFPDAARGRDGTGIDGVSLGGYLALEAGLRHPEAFAAVGAIQPAIRRRERHMTDLASAAVRTQRRRQYIRLLTSGGDPFLEPTRALSESLRRAGVAHDFVLFPGPHDYVFNRGPGSMELLRFHEDVLVRETTEGPTNP